MKKTKLRSVSKKRQRELMIYHGMRYKLLSNRNLCEYPDCISFATQIHHIRGRNGARLIDAEHFMLVCATHHNWIHDNPARAKAIGLLK